jgi:hypothetical protein
MLCSAEAAYPGNNGVKHLHDLMTPKWFVPNFNVIGLQAELCASVEYTPIFRRRQEALGQSGGAASIGIGSHPISASPASGAVSQSAAGTILTSSQSAAGPTISTNSQSAAGVISTNKAQFVQHNSALTAAVRGFRWQQYNNPTGFHSDQSHPIEGRIDPVVLAALPADIRAEILSQTNP